MTVDILLGDCLDLLRDAPIFDAIITDPPGGGRFMNIAFDSEPRERERPVRVRLADPRQVDMFGEGER